MTQGFSPNNIFLAPLKGLVAGDAHACAVTVEGGVLCWGNNHHGQLGDGTKLDRQVPTPVLF
jgi:alpha-tubulin suppressor-like RCC1 family protein